MRIIAPMMILIMMTSTLAGCTGGDPDSGENDNIDMDVINSLIDDNLQDFINNTTITVENHYHNNTTIVNNNYDSHYNNTTNVDGGEINNYDNSISNINGSGYSADSAYNQDIYVIDIIFNLDTLLGPPEDIDYRNNTFTLNWTYYDYITNDDLEGVFTVSCTNFYLVGIGNTSTGIVPIWSDTNGYYDAWDSIHNNTIRDMLSTIWNEDWLREICDENYHDEDVIYYTGLLLHEIELPQGTALQCVSFAMMDTWFWNNELLMWDESSGRSTGDIMLSNGNYLNYYSDSPFDTQILYQSTPWSCSDGLVGGHEDITLSIYLDKITPNYEYRFKMYYQLITIMPVE